MGAVLVSNEWNLRLEESVKFYGETGGDRGRGGTQFSELTLTRTALKPLRRRFEGWLLKTVVGAPYHIMSTMMPFFQSVKSLLVFKLTQRLNSIEGSRRPTGGKSSGALGREALVTRQAGK